MPFSRQSSRPRDQTPVSASKGRQTMFKIHKYIYSMLEGVIKYVALIAVTKTHKIIIKDYGTTSMKRA